MATRLVTAAFQYCIAAEADDEANGVSIVVRNKQFNRETFIARIIAYYLGGDYDAGETPPNVVVCMRKDSEVAPLRASLNRKLKGNPAVRILQSNARQQGAQGVMVASCVALRDALTQLGNDTFDLVIVTASTPMELNRFHEMFTTLDAAFVVLIISGSMYDRGELTHWPALRPPCFVTNQVSLEQPAPPST